MNTKFPNGTNFLTANLADLANLFCMKSDIEDGKTLLYVIITLSFGFSGFYYTDQYLGWGHGASAALAVGAGLGAFGLLFSAIRVSEMTTKKSVVFLSVFALIGLLFSGFLVLGRG